MSKLLASYGRDDEFKAVAEQIILEEEQKNNKVLAKTLRKSLLMSEQKSSFKGLGTLLPFSNAASEYIELIEPNHAHKELVLDGENLALLDSLKNEFRHSSDIRQSGLNISNKILFCGPPGTGKTLTAEVFASDLGLPLYILKLDSIISSYLGETASNIRKVFEFSKKTPSVLFLDEFDSLARSREDISEHSELRRVVNSLLIFIERLQPKGFLIAATNLDHALDAALWRRFDEVLWFKLPDPKSIALYVNRKFKNIKLSFEPGKHLTNLKGFSFAEIERICNHSIKVAIIDGRSTLDEEDFVISIKNEKRRKSGLSKQKQA